ncbi:hypothetical protein PLESTF_000034900 [Pleodorina starrii]|nr:hypothetical protein PLESTF_000034900 [Pleodorina starrii]
MYAPRFDHRLPGPMLSRPAQHHPHRAPADPSMSFVKRQYAFLIVACLVAANTIFYSTSVLLTRLPDTTAPSIRRLPRHPAHSSFLASISPPSSSTHTTLPACNASASPYALQLRGATHFPSLAAFLTQNTLIMEDLHPACYWVITRQLAPDRASEHRLISLIDWGLTVPNSALLPLPAGVLPLFTRAPLSVSCSWEQAERQWQAAHAASAEVYPLKLREEMLNESAGVATRGLGHPQGLFYRVSLPVLLEGLEGEGEGAGEGEDGGKGEEAGEGEGRERGSGSGGGEGGGGGGSVGGRVARQERELFYAEDRFSGGERLVPMRSMTKALVALLCMALQDRGLLSVDDAVHVYLPAWREGAYVNMTLSMLLTHTAGYDNAYHDDLILAPGNISLLESAHRSLNRTPLVGPPGRQFLYTEIGFQVLGAVVEVAGGAPFHQLLESLVLRPAGLCSTRIVNWWADTLPTHGPLIPDCEAAEPPPAQVPAAGAASDSTSTPTVRRWGWLRGSKWGERKRQPSPSRKGEGGGRLEENEGGGAGERGRGGEEDTEGAGGGKEAWGGGGGDGGGGGEHWSPNPSIAIGGFTTAADLNRLLGLLANRGRAACCGPAVAAPAGGPAPSPAGGPTHGSADVHHRRSLHLTHGRRSRAGRRRDITTTSPPNSPPPQPQPRPPRLERGGGGAAAAAAGADASGGGGGGYRRRHCQCGARVVSERGIDAMLSRQPTPGLAQSSLVQAFMRATPGTAQLITGMGLLDRRANEAWRDQVWGGFGYGYGLWLLRNNATGDDHVWMFGAFNTVAGLLTLGGNSSAAAVVAAAEAQVEVDSARMAGGEGGRGVGSGIEREREARRGTAVEGGEEKGAGVGEGNGGAGQGVRVAVVGLSLSSFNGMWVVLSGYLAAAAA